jgi:probable phosphoglycerate mutase
VELLLVRHGLPVRLESDNGPADPGLAPEGHSQAQALGQWLAGTGIDALFTSPMQRAVETAAPLAQLTGLAPTVLDGLAEWDRDASSYVPLEELQLEAPETFAELATAMMTGQWEVLGIDMEGFRTRVAEAMTHIIDNSPGQKVAVVCHGGVINVFLARVLGLSQDLFFAPTYTGVSRVWASRKGHRGILSINEAPHLLPGLL